MANHLGITKPISLAQPTASDLLQSQKLADFTRGLTESADSAENRKRVLALLEGLLKQWSKAVSERHGLTDPAAASCRYLTFGSYFLGSHAPDDDIDTLCLGPPHASRQEFFEDFVEMLRREPAISEMQAILETYVPHIKLTCLGVQIDILYAQLVPVPREGGAPGTVDDVDIREDSALIGIDEKSVLSLNGHRVGMELLDLVPDADVFREALRCIKYWARRRGIYGNILGFPGGVAYAILVARVCQLYPRAAPSTILSRFFRWYSGWKFVPCNGLLLCPIREHNPTAAGADGVPALGRTNSRDPSIPSGRGMTPRDTPLGLKVWSPKHYPADRLDLMPIITPAYPSMNCTYNASETTRKLFKEELERANLIARDIDKAAAAAAAAAGPTSPTSRQVRDRDGAKPVGWSELFAPYKLFRDRKYRYFLRITIIGTGPDEYRQWFGWVESKLRFLVLKLEQCAAESQIPGLAMDEFVRPFPNVFHIQHGGSSASDGAGAGAGADSQGRTGNGHGVVWDEAQATEIAAGGFDMSRLPGSHASAFYFGLQMPSAPKPKPVPAAAPGAAATAGGEAGGASGNGSSPSAGGGGAAATAADSANTQHQQQQAQQQQMPHGGHGGWQPGGGGPPPQQQPGPSLDIGFVVQEFSKELRQWAHWDSSSMAISFQRFRRSELARQAQATGLVNMDFAPLEGLCAGANANGANANGAGAGGGGEEPLSFKRAAESSAASEKETAAAAGKRAASRSPSSTSEGSGDESGGGAAAAGGGKGGGGGGGAGFVPVGPDGDVVPKAKPAMSWAAVAKRSKTG